MPLQTIINAAGPLPISATFTPLADGPVTFVVTGTAWSLSAPNKIGIEVSLNGSVIGSATLFANQNSVHMTLPTLFLHAVIPSHQPQKIAIAALANTVTDFNDHFTAQQL